MEYGTSVQKVRKALLDIQAQVMLLPYANGLGVYYDVDPV
jgi:hypothetical protein